MGEPVGGRTRGPLGLGATELGTQLLCAMGNKARGDQGGQTDSSMDAVFGEKPGSGSVW